MWVIVKIDAVYFTALALRYYERIKRQITPKTWCAVWIGRCVKNPTPDNSSVCAMCTCVLQWIFYRLSVFQRATKFVDSDECNIDFSEPKIDDEELIVKIQELWEKEICGYKYFQTSWMRGALSAV